MNGDGNAQQAASSDARFLRIAGIAAMLTTVLGILINVVLEGAGPGSDASVAEILAYAAQRTTRLKLANGLRMAVYPLLPVFAVGLYRLVGPRGGGWRMVGMLGVALVPALGIPANAMATIAYWRLAALEQQPVLVTMLWSLSMVLFYAVFIVWGTGILGFSLAGRIAGQIPKWLGVLGVLAGVTGIGTGVGVSVVLTRPWASGLAGLGFMLTAVWIFAAGVVLVRAAQH